MACQEDIHQVVTVDSSEASGRPMQVLLTWNTVLYVAIHVPVFHYSRD